MLQAANVMARQQQQRGRGRGGALRLAAVVLLVALLALCLARADAAASLAGRAPSSLEKGVASARENARSEGVERGHYTTLAAAEEEDDGPVVPERVELEVIEDYEASGANNRHQPHP